MNFPLPRALKIVRDKAWVILPRAGRETFIAIYSLPVLLFPDEYPMGWDIKDVSTWGEPSVTACKILKPDLKIA